MPARCRLQGGSVRRRRLTQLPYNIKTSRKRSTLLSVSSPITFARFRSQLLTESFLQTKAAVTFCAASFVVRFVTVERSRFMNRSFLSLRTSSQRRWATFFLKSARNKKRSKKQFGGKNSRLTGRWTLA